MVPRENAFRSTQWLPHSIEHVFEFFSRAKNLERITPPFLSFTVLTPEPIAMGVGTRIDYRLRLHGIPIRWQSEITGWAPPHRFTDEQRRGPYRTWRHTHSFATEAGGTRITDEISYSVPGGRLVDRFLVRRDVEKIFAYRCEAIEAIFAREATKADR